MRGWVIQPRSPQDTGNINVRGTGVMKPTTRNFAGFYSDRSNSV